MKFTNLWVGTALAMFSFGASAATITYNLNLSNDLPDGTTYAQVTIADGADAGVAGDVDFLVEINESAFDLTGATNFGMQTFAFNYDVDPADGTPTIYNIDPTSWEVTDFKGSVSEFGKFEFDLVSDGGNDRTSTLSFSITGVEGDLASNYAIFIGGDEGVPPTAFATHIAGFAGTECESGICESAFFAGGPVDRGLEPPPVPVPAAAWLFASGLIGLVGVARRKNEV